MSSREEGSRLSISEEKLRLALSEMEWRLKTFFNEQLRHKAESADVVAISRRIDGLDRGDFTPVHERALREFIDQHLDQGGDSRWKGIQRVISVVAIVFSGVSLLVTLSVLLHSGSL